MNKLDQILQEIVNLSYDEIRMRAVELANNCKDGFDALKIENISGIAFVEKFLAATVAVNGEYSQREQMLISELFKKPDRIETIADQITKRDIKNFDKLVDSLPEDLKSDCCLLASYVLAVDEHIDTSEYEYLVTLLQ
ncbi:MAG: hypothetical protein IJS94_05085 [Clostridia bacterium]|nr:hypothetical protein [Clostridia bacterium]